MQIKGAYTAIPATKYFHQFLDVYHTPTYSTTHLPSFQLTQQRKKQQQKTNTTHLIYH